MSSIPFKIESISLIGIWGIDSKDSSHCICKRNLLAPTIEELKEKRTFSILYKGRCGHVFHPQCIKKILEINRICPTCKAPWNDEQQIDTRGIKSQDVKQYNTN
jgi:hypothetical protein